jgi:hypothetical protein
MPKQVLISRLSKRLHENLAVAEGFARWAVESWALALGVVTLADITNEPNESPTEKTSWTAGRSGRDSRYDAALVGCDQAMLQLFANVVVEYRGKTFPIPVIYASEEDAVAYILGEQGCRWGRSHSPSALGDLVPKVLREPKSVLRVCGGRETARFARRWTVPDSGGGCQLLSPGLDLVRVRYGANLCPDREEV